MNKRRLEEAVPRAGGFAHAEAAARAINAEPWEPLPGMVKRQCPGCRYWFATRPDSLEPRCQDCIEKLPPGRRRPAADGGRR
jgi:hypothetical protein